MEPEQFAGRIADYHWDAEPHWPTTPRAPEGAPNVVIVLLDDVGFAQLGCFGSDLATPHMDALAARGLRYSNFHTTALCSPTRATVLTGRNHHSVGMGRIIQLATGFPGYDARIPPSAAFAPAMLTPHGYAAWAVGKWHLTPEDETHLGACRDRWPLGRGFERFYGFFDGETHQNAPALVHDSHQVMAPRSVEEGYHFTEDIVDRAIEYTVDLRHVDADKPFFLYLTPGACHSPHQAPAEFIDAYRGAFDDGWDVWRETTFARQKALGILPEHTELSPRPDWVPAWDSLSDRARRVYARYMEAFAGFLTHTDHHLGRLVAHLEATGDLDNTLLMVLSDNGASSEGGPVGSLNDVRTWNAIEQSVQEADERLEEIGGPRIHNNYPWGWTVAGNTPFKRWKREVHEGGVADPLIVSWPARLDGLADSDPRTRRQYVHSIDLLPTILEAIGIEAPAEVAGVAQEPLEGTSFLSTLDDPAAPEVRTVQYYEMFACRAIYVEGWKAVAHHPIQDDEPGIDRVEWELYDLVADPSECHDRAGDEPDRLATMVERWWEEARRYQVLPLDNRPFSELVLERPESVPHRSAYVYHPHTAMVPEPVAVNVKNRPHVVRATVADVPPDGGGGTGSRGTGSGGTTADPGGAGPAGATDLLQPAPAPSPGAPPAPTGDGRARGVIIGQGSVLGGWLLYIDGAGHLTYTHNLSGREQFRVAAPEPLGPGPHEVEMRYGRRPEQPKAVDLVVDDVVVATGEIPRAVWNRFSLTGAGLCCGWVSAPSPCDGLRAPGTFEGSLSTVTVEVDGDPVVDPIAEAHDAIVAQ
jgi:arylsulfatase A-like enzyme